MKQTVIKGNDSEINALINLLEDEDLHVSNLAMERLLKLEDVQLEKLISEFQESPIIAVRNRIHQLTSILNIRRARTEFIANVQEGNITLWDGIKQINYLFSPQSNISQVDRIMDELREKLKSDPTTMRVAMFMRNESFTFTGEDIFGSDLYLIEDVLIQRVGAPILLSVIAQQLGEGCGWHASIVLYKGKHCLIDDKHNLIEPFEGWRISRLTRNDKLHPCSNKDIWMTILSQLFLASMLEGRLQGINRVGYILAKLCGGSIQELPFPLGS
jgi:hypothetical protein